MTTWLRSSIAVKMALLVLGGTGIVFSLVLTYSYVSSRQIILKESKANALNLALAMSRRIEQEFRAVAKVPQSLVAFLENSQWDEKVLLTTLQRMVTDNSEIYGMAVAFQPFAFNKDVRDYAPYYYKTPEGLQFCQVATPEYNYFQQDWYHIPLELKAPVVSEPYFDDGAGDVLMVSYSCPFFEHSDDGKRINVRGVITADVDLKWLSKLVAAINESQKGFSFVVTNTGAFVTHPNMDYVNRESLFSLAETQGDPKLRPIIKQMFSSNKGFLDLGPTLGGQDSFLAYSKILATGWRFGSIFPKSEIFAEVDQLHHITFIVSLLGMGLLVIVSVLVAGSIARPLKQMAAATEKVAHGDLDIQLEAARRTDEVGMLAQSFTHMAQGLKERDFIRDAFGRYVTQEVVNRLLESTDGLKLGGEIREISMMMSDIRGFTSLTAHMKPEDIITLLNRYLGTMVEILLDHRGIIDEIIGDGILAFFGAPEPLEDHPERAVACALKMQDAMNEINATNLTHGLPTLEMGIAVNTGSVVVGNIGSDKRVKYGAVGPHVNFTGRMESFTLGGQVLISQPTYDRLSDILDVKNVLQVEMKGFDGKVNLYDIRGIQGKYKVSLQDFDQALRPLREPITITYYRLSEKTMSTAVGNLASITSLSAKEATIVCPEPIPAWTNLRIALHGDLGEIPEAVVYLKVVSQELVDEAYRIQAHFTSVSPQASTILDHAV